MVTIEQVTKVINDFLNNGSNVIYVIDANGNTFTLENGCLLLGVDNSHMQTYEKEVQIT